MVRQDLGAEDHIWKSIKSGVSNLYWWYSFGHLEFCAISMRGQCPHELFGIQYREILCSPHLLTYSFICLHVYRLMNIYFRVWVIIQYRLSKTNPKYKIWRTCVGWNKPDTNTTYSFSFMESTCGSTEWNSGH
jgi:hypothetical protein